MSGRWALAPCKSNKTGAKRLPDMCDHGAGRLASALVRHLVRQPVFRIKRGEDARRGLSMYG